MTTAPVRQSLYRPSGSTADGGFQIVVTPENAGWGYTSLRVFELPAGGIVDVQTGDAEMILLPLSGGCRVRIGGDELTLEGRTSVFDGVTDFAYLPIASLALVSSREGGVFALPGAKTDRRLDFRYGAAADVPVEVRGAGNCSRQVNNFATPAGFETAKLIACEVLTPAGNWSSYPPHKHDEASADESELEEIYYYRFRSTGPSGDAPARVGGFQQVFGTAARPIEVLTEVADGDIVLVPYGWHGPSIASPAQDMYYLNPMAGPQAERVWKITDEPQHAWVRDTWATQALDPRLPFYRAPARTP